MCRYVYTYVGGLHELIRSPDYPHVADHRCRLSSDYDTIMLISDMHCPRVWSTINSSGRLSTALQRTYVPLANIFAAPSEIPLCLFHFSHLSRLSQSQVRVPIQHPTRSYHHHSSFPSSSDHRLKRRPRDVLLANIVAAPSEISPSLISPSPKSRPEPNIQQEPATTADRPRTQSSIDSGIGPATYSLRIPSLLRPKSLSVSPISQVQTQTQHPTRTCHHRSSSSSSTGHRLEHRPPNVLLANIVAAPSEIPLCLSQPRV